MYESFKPGPEMGEVIAIDFVRLDGVKGLLFAAAQIGALVMSRPDHVDLGWLGFHAAETCGEEAVREALCQAGAADPRIEAWRQATLAADARLESSTRRRQELRGLSFEQLQPRIAGLRQFDLMDWGRHAGADDAASAANALVAAHTDQEKIQHVRIFLRRPFPLAPDPLLELSLSPNDNLASAAADALAQITHPSVRDVACRLIRDRRPGREMAIAMLAQNWQPNDHELALTRFENETDRDPRHSMQIDLRRIWEEHPEPASELRMLHLSYENGPCSFCREYVVERLLELDSLPASIRAECAHDANHDIRMVVKSCQTRSQI
jgi:hypothetical protein